MKTLLESAFYRIPRFQRPYSWDRENVSDFWLDAVVSEDPDYFIGSFVVYRSSSGDTLMIVDGQQRITTITLLLAAIRDAFLAEGHDALARGVQGLIERPDINNDPRYVLRSDTPYPYLQEHIQKFGEPELAASTGAEEDALESAYVFLRAQISASLAAIDSDPSATSEKKVALKKARLIKFRDSVLRLQLILIQIGNEDDAYLIFETLNTRGKDLKVSDLVKNHLTRILRPTNRGVDVAKDKWNSILELFDASAQDIDVNRFLHHSWLSRRQYLPEKKLFREIKRNVDKSNARRYLDELVGDAALYRRIVEPSSYRWPNESKEVKDSLQAVALFRVVQSVPTLLSILRAQVETRLTLRQVRQVIRALENFHVQFTAVTAQRTGGGTAQMFALAARSIELAADKNAAAQAVKDFVGKLRARLPNAAEFQAGFAQIHYTESSPKQRPLVRYLLSRFDEAERSNAVIDYSAMTVEHLTPQNPSGVTPLPDEIVGSLGNLILIPPGLNNKLANKTFERKRELLKKAGVPLDNIVLAATDWTPAEIAARTAYLGTQAQTKVFKI